MFSWRGQKILLTGGFGFLGRNMQETIAKLGIESITVFTPEHRAFDLTIANAVKRVYERYKPTAVIHMAGLVGGIQANLDRPAEFFYNNLMMGAMLMHYAQESGMVEKFVAVGAGCGYPEQAPIPSIEEDFWEGYPQAPSAPYSLAKRMLIVQAQSLHRQHGFRAVVGIPGNIYGPHDNFNLNDAHVIPALVRKFVDATLDDEPEVVVWGSGQATRDYVYAQDVCEGLLYIAEHYDTPEMVNLSTGEETSVAEVVYHLVRLTGYQGEVKWDKTKPEGQLRRCFSTAKAKAIGWTAKTGLAEGLERTVNWYTENRETARR